MTEETIKTADDLFAETTVITPDDVMLKENAEIAEQEHLIKSGQLDSAGLQKIHTTYNTAVSVIKPRQLKKALQDTKAEVEIAPDMMYYNWQVKSKHGLKTVEGGTIGLSLAIARNFGNCAVDTDVQELPTHYIFTAAFIDLETGFTLRRTFRQRKAQNIGAKYGEERAEDITFQIGQSKAIRNVVLNAVPQVFVKKLIEYAKYVQNKEYTPEQIEDLKNRMIAFFKERGISEKQIGDYLDQPDPAKWSRERVIDLGTTAKAIENNELNVSDVFPETDAKQKTSKKSKE